MAMHHHAEQTPAKHAIIMEQSGSSLTFGELDNRSRQIARLLRSHLAPGDRFGLLMENCPAYFEISWAARRAGLRWVPINWHLRAEEVSYVAGNSDCKVLIASPKLAAVARQTAASTPAIVACYSSGEGFDQFTPLAQALTDDLGDYGAEREGIFMFYSSGTTGHPKGILRPLPDAPFGTPAAVEQIMHSHYGFDHDTVFYAPGPLYHAAPLGWTMGAQMWGGTAISTEKFDAERTLASIEKHRVTHAMFVPTHMTRMLKLPREVREKYDCSSLKMVVHAAAPCPPDVKRGMIDWWGPIIHEFYGSSEGSGFTVISSEEWLSHPGSVGRVLLGIPHILDDEGNELPVGETGELCFENVDPFEYHKDPGKTNNYFDQRGWAHTGDLARLDEEGYLYLAGRSSGMIISGGVNIYPQEVENLLALHPLVADIAVVGVPDDDLGEIAEAVVQLAQPVADLAAVTEQLKAACQEKLALYKTPRSFRYVKELPRLPSGKLLHRYLDKPKPSE